MATNNGFRDQRQRMLPDNFIESTFGDNLVNTLERNYLDSRNRVFSSKEMQLMTPIKFLSLILGRFEDNLHTETYEFKTKSTGAQFRTEMFFGGFCGVAHAITENFSIQLATAHLLERIKLYFKPFGLGSCNYALYPGSTHTKLEKQLEKLCSTISLGQVKYTVKDLRFSSGFCPGAAPFECSCNVRNQQISVLHDSMYYGKCFAAAQMFKMQSECYPSLKKHQTKDHYAVGADCPTSFQLNLHQEHYEQKKLDWMNKHQVGDIDTCLNDPTNTSSYLDVPIYGERTYGNSEEGIKFKTDFETAIKEINDTWT
ncbi:unnamed protein product [Orchesella dallaii]|uniref:Uncharacterized protein n=1 Tax=Orchesella dallaii TaxID=48710 RepID=A0ABP1R3X7_9HEXA